jgi:hypothetical protein
MKIPIGRAWGLLLVSLLLLSSALGAQHLEGSDAEDVRPSDDLYPETGVLSSSRDDEYHLALYRRLLANDPIRYCQIVFLPSFRNESAAYIVRPLSPDRREGTPEVVSVELVKQLYGTAESERKRFLDVSIGTHRSQAPIDLATFDLLQGTWRRTIVQGRPRDRRGIADGVIYSFATLTMDLGWISAQTHEPREGTWALELVRIGEALQRYPNQPEAKRLEAQKGLAEMAGALLERLPPEN